MGGGRRACYFGDPAEGRRCRGRASRSRAQPPDDTFGWGVVFSDRPWPASQRGRAFARAIVDSFYHWDDIDVHIHGASIRTGGHGFAGIERKRCSTSCRSGRRASASSRPFSTRFAMKRSSPMRIC
jgi:anthraniloyl-CoA monooxygenase